MDYADRLAAMRATGALQYQELAALLRTRSETVSRWLNRHCEPQHMFQRRIDDVERVFAVLGRCLPPAKAHDYLYARQQLYGGRTAAAMIRDGEGQVVIRQLTAMAAAETDKAVLPIV